MASKSYRAKLVDTRSAEPLESRLTYCRQMLYLHGLLAEGVNDSLKTRIAKYLSKRAKEESRGNPS